MHPIIVSTLLASVIGGAAFSAVAQTKPESDLDLRPKVGFGAPLQCVDVGTGSMLSVAKADPTFHADPSNESWVAKEMARVGFGASMPKQAEARQAAVTAASLLRGGNLVASMMANDEASRTLPAYKAAPFSANFESLLTILTQPVLHASYPSSVLAEGEVGAGRSAHSHGVDLERSSASLLEVIRRAQMSKKAMGKDYETVAVRYYLLASGFHDALALKAATGAVCALHLTDEVRTKLDVSARFMAMPSATAGSKS